LAKTSKSAFHKPVALRSRIHALEQKAKDDQRKRETRRKIIVGGVVLAEMAKDDDFAGSIATLLAHYVGRPHDRDAVADLLRSNHQQPSTASLSEVGGEIARLLNREGEV
jgi:hypothetical protein